MNYFLPYEQINSSCLQFTRKRLTTEINKSDPVVWCNVKGQWYWSGWGFSRPSGPCKCNSKEDGMKELDECLIAAGAILVLPGRAEKLKLLL
jgi:hypothetical protein